MRTTRPDTVTPLTVQVHVRNRQERARLARRVQAGGCAVLGKDDAPTTGEIATVASVIELSAAERAAVQVLPLYDHAAEMAEAVGVEAEAIRKTLQHLQRALGVHARHRLIVRLLEYGVLRLRPDVSVTPIVVEVLAADAAKHGELAQWLRDGGDSVMEGEEPPYEIRLNREHAAGHVTEQQQNVLRVFLVCEHTAEMAARLKIGEDACADHLQHLEEETEVHSRHRLVVELVRHGFLSVERRT